MFRNILVPVDLSNDSRVAVHHAADIARRTNGQLTLIHVDEVAGHGLPSSEALTAHLEASAATRERWVQRVIGELDATDFDIRIARSIGSAAREVLDYIEAERIDLVVMGRRGLGGIERILVGSTSKRVVTHAPVPVLVVPSTDGQTPDDPVRSIAWKRIMTPTDFSPASDEGLGAVGDLCDVWDAEQLVAHAAHVPLIAASAGEPPFVLPAETRGQLQQLAESDLAAAIERVGLPSSTRTVATAATSVPHALLELADENDVDVIAVPSHGKGAFRRMLFGSTTLRLLALSSKPLLVLPRVWLDARPQATARDSASAF